MTRNIPCPACDSKSLCLFYSLDNVPVQSVLLLASRPEALNIPLAAIRLYFCHGCGFIFNASYDPQKQDYSHRYEPTQFYSPVYREFSKSLASRLVQEFKLKNKTILEIGCGRGEFLETLCRIGKNQGLGFDPSFDDTHQNGNKSGRVTIIKDFYTEKYSDIQADMICCRMTLEHIHHPYEFLRVIRNAVNTRSRTVVFFQVPDVVRILRGLAFWDVYYEHCSYFSPGSLGRIFKRAGFEIADLRRGYQNQYILISALAEPVDTALLPQSVEEDPAQTERDVYRFQTNVSTRMDAWKILIGKANRDGKKIAIWGGGSKAVAFLTTLQLGAEIEAVVDVNPYKQGTFAAGTGHEIISPSKLTKMNPDLVIVMNPVYKEEISACLKEMAISPVLLTVEGSKEPIDG